MGPGLFQYRFKDVLPRAAFVALFADDDGGGHGHVDLVSVYTHLTKYKEDNIGTNGFDVLIGMDIIGMGDFCVSNLNRIVLQIGFQKISQEGICIGLQK